MPVNKGRSGIPNAYKVRLKGKERAEIYVYGDIGFSFWGDGVTAKQFADDLKKLGDVKTIELRINSYGGIVDDARAMYNLLVDHEATIDVHIDGIAASAASLLAMAGDTVAIAESGFFMIHNVQGGVVGTAADLREYADVLDKYNDQVVKTYADRTSIEEKKIRKWMADETWFTGAEAVENGFADSVTENVRAAAHLAPPGWVKNAPLALRPNRARAAALVREMKSYQ